MIGTPPFLHLTFYIGIGPCPIQLVVVMAVRKAVRAVKSTKSLCTFRSESYHLHRYLNNSIRLHNFHFSKFKVQSSKFKVHRLVLSQAAA